jgi:hypothetical protein
MGSTVTSSLSETVITRACPPEHRSSVSPYASPPPRILFRTALCACPAGSHLRRTLS